jgi:hypothetical protein
MVKILPPDPFFPKKKRKKMLIIHTSVGLHAYPPGWPHTNSINNELKQKAGRVTAGSADLGVREEGRGFNYCPRFW